MTVSADAEGLIPVLPPVLRFDLCARKQIEGDLCGCAARAVCDEFGHVVFGMDVDGRFFSGLTLAMTSAQQLLRSSHLMLCV